MSHPINSLSLEDKEKLSNLFISCFRTRSNQNRFNKNALHDFNDNNINWRFRSFILGYLSNKKVNDITDKFFITQKDLFSDALFLTCHLDSPTSKKYKLFFDTYPNGTFKDKRVYHLHIAFSKGLGLKFY